MRKLTITKLHCTKTEDWRTDECTLILFRGNNKTKSWNKDMKKGTIMEIGYILNFEQEEEFQLKLYDRDGPDPDDLLGTVDIITKPAINQNGIFNKDGAKYEIYYNIEEIVDPVSFKRLKLNSLECEKTEDMLGADECTLKIFRNNYFVDLLEHKMKKDDILIFDKEFDNVYNIYNSPTEQIIIELYDRDMNKDEVIDIKTLKTIVVGNYELDFTSFLGSNYTLLYSIISKDGKNVLQLKTLICKTVQYKVGKDECKLEILKETSCLKTFKKKMKKGDKFDLKNCEIPIIENNSYKAGLYEEDSIDRPDLLGREILSDVCGVHSALFEQDGAKYKLNYSIENFQALSNIGSKLYVMHLPISVPIINKVADHTYLVAEDATGNEKKWKALGGADGGKILKKTSTVGGDKIDITIINYLMTEAPGIWAKTPFYYNVGVCWNACNRGLYFTGKTVEEIPFYCVIELICGTYGIDENSKCSTEDSTIGKQLYSWTKALKSVKEKFPWVKINDEIMSKSENKRIRIYHEFFGDTASQKNKELLQTDRWYEYTKRLLELRIEETLGEIDTLKRSSLTKSHKNRHKLLFNVENKTILKDHLDDYLDEARSILTDDEFQKFFNAEKTQSFVL